MRLIAKYDDCKQKQKPNQLEEKAKHGRKKEKPTSTNQCK